MLEIILGYLGVWTPPLKYYVWSRKIVEGVYHFEDTDPKKIVPYLKKCRYFKKKFGVKPVSLDNFSTWTGKYELHCENEVERIFNFYLPKKV